MGALLMGAPLVSVVRNSEVSASRSISSTVVSFRPRRLSAVLIIVLLLPAMLSVCLLPVWLYTVSSDLCTAHAVGMCALQLGD